MRSKNMALALLATAQFVVVLDASIVNVALPSIGRDLDFAQDDLSWVVNAYTLFFGGFLLLGGRLADLLGRRRIFILGMWLFAIASLAGGLAQSDIWLVIARAVQGLGAALISPAALAILTTTFAEGAERNKALAVWGAVAGSGGAVGVLAGGMLTEWAGWEWVLFVNTPIGIAAALLAPRIVDDSRDESNPSWDIAGAVTVTAGLSLLVYTLVDANSAGWGSAQTIGLGALSLVLLASFVVIELRQRYPLIPFSIFKLRTLRGSNVLGLLLGMSLFAMFFFISLYMQQVLGYDPLKAGLAYLPLAGLIIVSAGGASQLVARVGFKAGADHRAPVHRRGPVLVQQGERTRRQLRRRRAVPGDARRRGARPLVRAGHDRRGHRHEAQRGRARVRPHQHLAAGGRRPGPRDSSRRSPRAERRTCSPPGSTIQRSPTPRASRMRSSRAA
jgi:EmrB/QacA subfamily drug resistance transporter